MLVEFLQIIVGAKLSPSQDCGAKIMYAGKIFPQETIIKDVLQTKNENNVNVIMRTQIKNCLGKVSNNLRYFKANQLLLSNEL